MSTVYIVFIRSSCFLTMYFCECVLSNSVIVLKKLAKNSGPTSIHFLNTMSSVSVSVHILVYRPGFKHGQGVRESGTVREGDRIEKNLTRVIDL